MTYEWNKIEPIKNEPTKRTLHSSCIVDDNMYVFGGKSINSLLSQKVKKKKKKN